MSDEDLPSARYQRKHGRGSPLTDIRTSILGAASTLATLGLSSPHEEQGMTTPPPVLDSEVSEEKNSVMESPSQEPLSPSSASEGVARSREHIGDIVPMTFPQKLMEILSKEENSDVITWLDHGKGFMIIQKKRFVTEVMPMYFKQSKFTSFTRKLNRWGFIRVSRGPEMGAYYHRLFQRNNLRLCLQMTCQPNKPSSPINYGNSRQSMNPTVYPALSRQPMDTPVANTNNRTVSFPRYDAEEAQRVLAAAAARRETMIRLARLQREQLDLLRQQTAYLKKIEAARASSQQQTHLHQQQIPYCSQDARQQLDLLLQQKRAIHQSSSPHATSFHSVTSRQMESTPFLRTSQPFYDTSQMTRSYLAMSREKAAGGASLSNAACPIIPIGNISSNTELDSQNQLSMNPSAQCILPQNASDDRGRCRHVAQRRASAA